MFKDSPTDIKIVRKGDIGLLCRADANPPARITWTLNGQNIIDNTPIIKMQNFGNGNFSYKCSATNLFGSSDIRTTNREINNVKKLQDNYNIMMWAIVGTVFGLLVISISVCRYAFKTTEKHNVLPW